MFLDFLLGSICDAMYGVELIDPKEIDVVTRVDSCQIRTQATRQESLNRLTCKKRVYA